MNAVFCLSMRSRAMAHRHLNYPGTTPAGSDQCGQETVHPPEDGDTFHAPVAKDPDGTTHIAYLLTGNPVSKGICDS